MQMKCLLAIIVQHNEIIARGYNQVELLKDATAHAEIIALTTAFGALGSKYLPEATLYVTLEPCLMCAGALYWVKLGGLYMAQPTKNGYSRYFPQQYPFHPKTTLTQGVLADEAAFLMKAFFRRKR